MKYRLEVSYGDGEPWCAMESDTPFAAFSVNDWVYVPTCTSPVDIPPGYDLIVTSVGHFLFHELSDEGRNKATRHTVRISVAMKPYSRPK